MKSTAHESSRSRSEQNRSQQDPQPHHSHQGHSSEGLPQLPHITLTRGSGNLSDVVYLALHRPDKLNGVTLDMLRSVETAAAHIKRNRSIRAVILTGAEGNFTAGLDFSAVKRDPKALLVAFLNRPWRGTNLYQNGPWCLRKLPVPVIAAVEGYCFGAGVQFALAADYRFTAPDATWSVLEAKWGLIPDMTGIHTLSQQVSMDVAKRLSMTGEQLTGEQATELGLASEVAADPVAAAEELARRVIARSPDSVSYAKQLFDETWSTSARHTFFKERLRQARLLASKNTKIAQKAAAKAKGIGEALSYRDREV